MKLLLIILIFLQLNYYKCDNTAQNTFSHKYPNCIELKNGNVLIVFSDGIYIYNSKLSEELNNISYESDFSLNENDNNLVNLSMFDDGLVISIIKTYLYIFSSIGEYIFHFNLTNELQGATYYSLLPHKINENNYYYIITYINSSTKIIIKYYYINLTENTNNLIDSFEYSHNDSSFKLINNNKGLTCQLMAHPNIENVLSCFYEISFPNHITVSSFLLGDQIRLSNIPIIYLKNDVPGYFKSAITNDKTRAFICYSTNGNHGNCFFYNMANNSFSEERQYFKKCADKPKSIHVDFFIQTKEFIFSCYDDGTGLTIMKFEENGNVIGSFNNSITENYYFEGTHLYSYSILFLSKYSQYSIILTTTEYCISNHFLLPDNFNPSNIYNISEESNIYLTTSIVETVIVSENNIVIGKTNIEEDFNDYKECSKFKNGDIKCLYCNEESLKLNKCIECNKKLGYYPFIYLNEMDNYKQCYNNKTKLNNFYFDVSSYSFKLCYDLCNTCVNGGNKDENNCTSCISGYIFNPDEDYPNNCVVDCSYNYYYTAFGQYRCTINGQCPLENYLLIRSKGKCVNNCSIDSFYKYQYNSECFGKCPDNTNPNILNICQDNNINICSLSNYDLYLYIKEIKVDNIELSAINYAKEYLYTNNHISQFNNEFYSYILFKNSSCIDELFLNFSIIDFNTCYNEVKQYYNITDELIISILNLKNNNNKPFTYYEVFNPETGNKINIENICGNQSIIIKENLINYIKDNKNLVSEQKIDIFNLNSSFYTDICYHFESPNGKDVTLKDRILSFYPNISLCDNGCEYKRINLETFKSECECKINNFVNNYLLTNKSPISETKLADILNLVKESNILVLKCYKDLANSKYYKNNKGLFIIIFLIFIQILCTIIFTYRDLFKIKKYIYILTQKYSQYMHKTKINIIFYPPIKKNRNYTTKENLFSLNENNNNIIKKTNTIFTSNYEKNNSSKNIFLKRNRDRNKKCLTIVNNKHNNKNMKESYKTKKIKFLNKDNSDNIVISEENNKFNEYLITSLNDLDFDEAVDLDKRNIYKIFIDLVKDEHLIIRTFFISDNVRPRSIKILLFIIVIDLYFVINALMYNEEYISELYNTKEDDSFFDFLTNSLGRLISVSIISFVIRYFVEYYFIEEKKVKKIFMKNQKIDEIKSKIYNIIKSISKKYKSFIIVSYFITIFSLYYIFCFNNVYPNTSLNWIKSTIFLIILIQLVSFVYIFIESFLRQLSFMIKSEFIFKMSKILIN